MFNKWPSFFFFTGGSINFLKSEKDKKKVSTPPAPPPKKNPLLFINFLMCLRDGGKGGEEELLEVLHLRLITAMHHSLHKVIVYE